MSNQNVKDGRSFFVLPQSYEGGGYYAYGAPGGGISQYAHPAMLTTIFNRRLNGLRSSRESSVSATLALPTESGIQITRHTAADWKSTSDLCDETANSFLARSAKPSMIALQPQD